MVIEKSKKSYNKKKHMSRGVSVFQYRSLMYLQHMGKAEKFRLISEMEIIAENISRYVLSKTAIISIPHSFGDFSKTINNIKKQNSTCLSVLLIIFSAA